MGNTHTHTSRFQTVHFRCLFPPSSPRHTTRNCTHSFFLFFQFPWPLQQHSLCVTFLFLLLILLLLLSEELSNQSSLTLLLSHPFFPSLLLPQLYNYYYHPSPRRPLPHHVPTSQDPPPTPFSPTRIRNLTGRVPKRPTRLEP